MQNETPGVKRDYPTQDGTVDRTGGHENDVADAAERENPPREDAAEMTRGCEGSAPRPIGPSARKGDNPSSTIVRLEYGRIAREFDAAEASEPTLDILEGKPALGGQRYRVEGETDGEWIETGYVVAVGGVGR
ncbi:hypothetical protein JMJ58_15075 [Haloterrigena salifodinae]|uniref:Uncharacterized protein n=1 Tax=Haloterrigena salifodinae TaxID=2675099 RepID=A0A8T8DXG2_9EURY|nr:hypothetical protein [Haloterrigena salifodinae]QRV14254.1 hypothetical protein JMJ58_15075 [Haloterrigena salifodinae]